MGRPTGKFRSTYTASPPDSNLPPCLQPLLAQLRDQGRGSSTVIFEGRRDFLLGLVITGEAVDAGFNKDEAEFRVLVLAVGLEVFANCNGLFHEVPEVFWDVGCEAYQRTFSEAAQGSGSSRRKREGGEEKGDVPCPLRIRRILLPVTKRTWGMPCESRRVTPIWDGVRPFRASFVMCSTTSCGDVLSHDGGARR